MKRKAYVVIDIGGTNLRIGWFDAQSGQLHEVTRHAVRNRLSMPQAGAGALQEAVIDQLLGLIRTALASPDWQAAAIGISFAGPINSAGEIVGAPTIWGEGGAPMALTQRLTAALDLPTHVLNDVTAAAWRYADTAKEPFCLVTVSSGIGNKVFYDGQVLINDDGYGGEIGHLRVDYDADAPSCDCGGQGHLGAIGSGRGTVAVAQRFARADPDGFAASQLAALCAGRAEAIDTHALAAAVHGGDAFAWRCVRHGIVHLARALAGLYAAIGVRRFIVMGGFAQALAPRYLPALAQELQHIGMFGIAPEAIPALLRMAAPDDDHGLIGAGRYLQSLPSAPPRPPFPAARAAFSSGVPHVSV